MAGTRRGHTAGGRAGVADEQLELRWEVPPATPATTDFVCWLWAAFPPRDGRLNVSRISKALEISTTTLRRWIAKDEPKLQTQQIRRLHQRAILRGHGHYLWPDLDPVTRRRSELLYADALRNDELIRTEPERVAPTWHKNGTLDRHVVQIVYFPRAHAYGVSAATHDKAQAKVRRHGEVIESTVVENKYAAIALKHEILRRVDEHRCITPRHLVPTGRTETWREDGGPATIRRPLEVTVVRFAGRATSYGHIAHQLRETSPAVKVTEHVVGSAQEACEALTAPADVMVLAAAGYTRQTWTAKRSWPGGRWYAGGRGSQDPGMSLAELEAGLDQLGGLQAAMVVVDTGAATATRAALRRIVAEAGTLAVVKVDGRSRPRELADLATLIHRVDLDREDTEAAVTGLASYRLI